MVEKQCLNIRKPWLFWVQPNGGFSLALGFWPDTGMVSWPSGGNHDDDDDAEEWICKLLRYNREALIIYMFELFAFEVTNFHSWIHGS